MSNTITSGGPSNVAAAGATAPAPQSATQSANDFANRALGKSEIDRRYEKLDSVFKEASGQKDAQGQPLHPQTRTVDAKTGAITTTIDMGHGDLITQQTIPGKSTTYEATGPRNGDSVDTVIIQRNANGSESLAEMNLGNNGRNTCNSETIGANGSQTHHYAETPAYMSDSDAANPATPHLAQQAAEWQFLMTQTQKIQAEAAAAGKAP